ncbi:MAG: fibronectin type III domain-containing protein [Betaproteobacteria bacterium]
MAINNPSTVADFGGTGSTPVASAANQLLATFNLAPQASATNVSYVISLHSVSTVAVDADGTCGATTVPSEAPITASFTLTRNNAPVFTSASTTTFSTAGANNFVVTATGTPAPTLSAIGVPAGVTFTPATGVLAGTPAAGGPYAITFTATNGVLPDATQNFSLVAQVQAGQVITFANPGTQSFGTALIPLTATGGGSGNPVVFTSITTTVCTVSGSNVTMIGLGTCTIAANQAGNASYLAATQVLQSFGIVGSVPGAPIIGTGTPGNAQATISFTPPASTGGSVITTYTASCNGISASSNVSPITVAGLTNGTPYTCTVTATNSLGTGPASGSVIVTPAVTPLALVSVVSRKVHGVAGTYSLPIATGVAINASSGLTIDSRLIGTGHTIVFQFSEAITSSGTVTAVDGAAAPVANSVAFAGNEVTVTLTGVADRTRVTVTLANVNGTGAGVTFPVSMGFLVGDQNGSYFVDGGDVSAIRARSGQAATAINFRGDFNASGAIDGGDISTVRARSGNSLP